MAQLHLALGVGCEEPDRVVVIKRLKPECRSSPSFAEMFEDEASLALRLRHENVPFVFGTGRMGPDRYISMEYLAGEDLLAILTRASRSGVRVPLEITVSVVRAVGRALDYAHGLVDESGDALGLVHRDVSPSNVLVTYDGHTKVLDFGIAKSNARLHQTRVGIFKGKLWYSAPEQLVGDPLDRRTDVFGLGIILWELLTGRRLFVGTELDVAEQIRSGRPIPPSAVRSELPRPIDLVVTRALARAPAERFPSAGELCAALDSAAEGSGLRFADEDSTARWMRRLFGEERAELKLSVRAGRDLERRIPQLAALMRASGSAPAASTAPVEEIEILSSVEILEPKAAWSSDAAGGVAWADARSSGAHPIHGLTALRRPARPPPIPTPRRRRSVALGAGLLVAISLAPLSILGARKWGCEAPERLAATAALLVDSEPSGAAIFVDGEPTGLVTPARVSLSAHHATVRVRLEAPGHLPAERTVALTSARGLDPVKVDLEVGVGDVTFSAVPKNALIYVDARPLAQARDARLSVGSHQVRVERDGALLFEGQVTVRPGHQTITLPGRAP